MRLFGWFWWLIGYDEVHPMERERAARQAEDEAQEQAHQQKINGAHHLLTGVSWRDSAGKEDFVRDVYGDEPPRYIWYALGDNQLSEEENEALAQLFYLNSDPRWGDLELHRSINKELGTVLRVRNPQRVVAEITVGGQACPLYQTGHRDHWARTGPEPIVLFLNLFEEPEPAECSD